MGRGGGQEWGGREVKTEGDLKKERKKKKVWVTRSVDTSQPEDVERV